MITKYTYRKAKKIGVIVKPSTVKNKKIDVFRDGHKIASVGAKGMNDYPTYMKTRGLPYANERRRLYKIRHNKDRKVLGSPGYYSDKILW